VTDANLFVKHQNNRFAVWTDDGRINKIARNKTELLLAVHGRGIVGEVYDRMLQELAENKLFYTPVEICKWRQFNPYS
jgi:hypothetical protein